MTSTDTINAHIARSRELAGKATEGPWKAGHNCCGQSLGRNSFAHQVEIEGHDYTVAFTDVKTGDIERTETGARLINPTGNIATLHPDAAFIAASRTLLPQYVEALSVAVAALKYAHEHSNDPVAFWLEEALSKIAAILSPP